jgi:hypothetical protein
MRNGYLSIRGECDFACRIAQSLIPHRLGARINPTTNEAVVRGPGFLQKSRCMRPGAKVISTGDGSAHLSVVQLMPSQSSALRAKQSQKVKYQIYWKNNGNRNSQVVQ